MKHFFAYISRMKLIQRWSLMRSVRPENVQEHCHQVAVVAHALAVIKNKFYNGAVNVDRVALLSLYHDATEVLTGDLPTPVKYFNTHIRDAFQSLETHAEKEILNLLPEELRTEFLPLFQKQPEDKELWKLIKTADTICAYIKCLEEAAAGNREFNKARMQIEEKLSKIEEPETKYFLQHFVPSFQLSLDEMSFSEI